MVYSTVEFSRRGKARSALMGVALGMCIGAGLVTAVLVPELRYYGLYVALQSVFHIWEFVFNAMFHPHLLSTQDFLLPWQHSDAFVYAFVAAQCEFWIEFYFFPSMKQSFVSFVGLLMVIVFQSLRTLAMYTAGSNFTHQIAEVKEKEHRLVTDGIYQYIRHPSYCGWYFWAVGTQVLLANPICVVAYAYVVYLFYADRIPYEEQTLCEHFGKDYERYAARVWSGVPFVK